MSLLSVSDAFCYICRGVLIEPVTLPCSHVFCFNCFELSMQETSHSCPLCRKRISNWIRSVKKSNKLVNTDLWQSIREQFKEQVRLKLNGEDDGLDQYIQQECEVQKPISKNGEVAQEFSKLLDDFRSERQKLREAEELASRELIERLRAEEEERLHRVRERNLRRLKEDEKLAKMMQEELKKEVSPKEERKEKKTSRGPMDDFIKNLSNSVKTRRKSDRSLKEDEADEGDGDEDNVGDISPSDSTDSLRMELNLFKPIKKVLRTPPKQYPDGRVREINLKRVTPLKLSFHGGNSTEPSSEASSRAAAAMMEAARNIHSVHSAFVDACSSLSQGARVDTDTDPDDDDAGTESTPKRLKYSHGDSGILKDITLGENSDSKASPGKKKAPVRGHVQDGRTNFRLRSPSGETTENDNYETQDYLNPSPTIEEKLIEEQRRIEQIIAQEKRDRELALKLSREWESEMRRKPQTRSMLSLDTIGVKKSSGSFKVSKTKKSLRGSSAISTTNRKK